MPELPEVETIRQQICSQLCGRVVCNAQVLRARAVRAHESPAVFIEAILGRTILEVQRRGKVILLPLDNHTTLLARLGMSGQLQISSADIPLLAHTYVILSFDNAAELRYIDPRTFGQMAVVAGHDPYKMAELSHYGVEPLGDEFSAELLARLLAGKKALIQAVLMDQRFVVGIGKIYADESCFLAGIDPRRSAASLNEIEVSRLHEAIRTVLTRAIAARGTSGADGAYRDAAGSLGSFQQQLHVYQRAGKPCRVCGTPIEFRPLQGRRMHFCPHCQR